MKKTLNNLIWLARQETPPAVDVADYVIASLGSVQAGADAYRAYTWFSIASAAVAACIAVVATVAWQHQADAVSEMLTYISWVQL